MSDVEYSKFYRDKAFTLIEILLVMVISSILVLGINASYRQSQMIWLNAEEGRVQYHIARLFTETLRQELGCLYFPSDTGEEQLAAFELSDLSADESELAFFTLAPSWKEVAKAAYIARIRYVFSRNTDTGEGLLQRYEQLCAGNKTIGKENSDVVIEGLSDFTVRVLEQNSEVHEDAWKDSYNSNSVPPKAVKLLLRWPAARTHNQTDFQFYFAIPCDSALLQQL
jgi:prepilin-type N-terminal cleavage/methylation domain-containing protein